MKKKYEPCWLDDEGLSEGLFKVLRKLAVSYQTEREILQIVKLHPELIPKAHRKELSVWLEVKTMQQKLKSITDDIGRAEVKLKDTVEKFRNVTEERYCRFMDDLKKLYIKHRVYLSADWDGNVEVCSNDDRDIESVLNMYEIKNSIND